MNGKKQSVLFVSHGSPMLMLDQKDGADYAAWGKALTKPKALLVFSAHWQTDELMFGETEDHEELIYDFWGFPDELYNIQYPAPACPQLVDDINQVLKTKIPQKVRGLDHGVYVPFIHMWPQANVPILQMSLPRDYSNQALFKLGKDLGPLREQNVLIIGAGALTHNLSAFNPANENHEPMDWAKAFDDWVAGVLTTQDYEGLFQWEQLAPHAKQNHPTPEHFKPLLIAAGAAVGDKVTYPTLGFSYGVFSRRSVQFA